MNTQKLTDALIEMKRQRAVLDAAIKNIENVLSTLSESSGASAVSTSAPRRFPRLGSYIDMGENILAEAGEPMHIADIARKISELRGKDTPRASVESSFIRHIKSFGANARIVKVSPARFGLPAWKSLFSDRPEEHDAA